uniref:B30.2/SPRY domain-containing protein n=1 Tax=Anser cygnoides TaxID=8845 RepID=A0A8B9E156_ANSCY
MRGQGTWEVWDGRSWRDPGQRNFLGPIRVEGMVGNKYIGSTNRKFHSSSLLALHYLTNDLIIAVDVTLDADTAHPRLRVSEDGKSVTDTGAIRRVSVKKKRFVYQAFVLAKEGYKSGTFYWEVDVGKRRNWILGVAQETVKRKEVVLSPQNGFWAIALADGQDYWVHTDPWTRLTVSGRPQKIGIFLDISAKKLSFYSVHEKKALYTFTFDSDHSQDVKLFPFFSTGSTAIKADTEPLRILCPATANTQQLPCLNSWRTTSPKQQGVF